MIQRSRFLTYEATDPDVCLHDSCQRGSAKALQKGAEYRKYLPWNYPKVRYLHKICKDGEAIIRWCEERVIPVERG